MNYATPFLPVFSLIVMGPFYIHYIEWKKWKHCTLLVSFMYGHKNPLVNGVSKDTFSYVEQPVSLRRVIFLLQVP